MWPVDGRQIGLHIPLTARTNLPTIEKVPQYACGQASQWQLGEIGGSEEVLKLPNYRPQVHLVASAVVPRESLVNLFVKKFQ